MGKKKCGMVDKTEKGRSFRKIIICRPTMENEG